jgi:hypothetical protein
VFPFRFNAVRDPNNVQLFYPKAGEPTTQKVSALTIGCGGKRWRIPRLCGMSSGCRSFWTSYQQANGLFCEELMKIIELDDSVWIHDFQWMLPLCGTG